jgi:hypothetical protein
MSAMPPLLEDQRTSQYAAVTEPVLTDEAMQAWRSVRLRKPEGHSSISPGKCATAQEVLVTVLSHPFRARQMAFECFPSARRLANGIDVQRDPRDLLPIRTFCVGVEQTQTGDNVFVIMGCQRQTRRRGIGDIRIKRRLLHGLLRTLAV